MCRCERMSVFRALVCMSVCLVYVCKCFRLACTVRSPSTCERMDKSNGYGKKNQILPKRFRSQCSNVLVDDDDDSHINSLPRCKCIGGISSFFLIPFFFSFSSSSSSFCFSVCVSRYNSF